MAADKLARALSNPPMRLAFVTLLSLAPLWLAGCDMLGIESATVVAARREAESKAIGAGCRHSARSVEECYGQNKRADKAAIFAGWKEMSEYMAENKLEAASSASSTTVAVVEETEAPDKKPGKAEARKQ